ncbi:hypothetical protein [Carboxylicivirga sp. N1Y90]|uniref:hypothetical protein n=1 Tax=Carboxylicivirga fragile TaxID=3417571 RepID=UPI003D33EB47|nr:hypothetical protein [Marinilabiliaceae bacterium N1Y90]
MKTIKKQFILSLSLILLVACNSSETDVAPDYNFMKVYDNADIEINYYPVDALETKDGSIVVLSALNDIQNTNFPTIHIMKTSASGKVIWETPIAPSYVSPVPNLMLANDQVRFVCMDDTSFDTKIIGINLNNGDITELGSLDESYPLAAHYNSDNQTTVILSYDAIGTSSIITGLNASFTQLFRASTATNKDFSYDIFRHLKKQRTPFPFFINSFDHSGVYYAVNGFSNYTLSLMMVNQSSGQITGRVNGFQELGGISAAIHKVNDQFAIASSKFNVGNVAIGADVNIDVNSTQNIAQLTTVGLAELKAEAPVKVLKTNFSNQEMIIYAATTKTNQVALYFFNAESNSLIKTHYLGHTNPMEISAFFKTKDKGLAVVGKAWVAGRYQRIIIHKLAYEQLELD